MSDSESASKIIVFAKYQKICWNPPGRVPPGGQSTKNKKEIDQFEIHQPMIERLTYLDL